MFNARGEWQRIYIDIAATTGLSDENIPYRDDLYLNSLLSPDTPPQRVDHDDLNHGLQQGVITQQYANDAYAQAHALIRQISHHNYDLIALCQTHFEQFINE